MKNTFTEKMKKNPIIAAVKDLDNLDTALKSECNIIFLLCGSIFNIRDAVDKVKKAGKMIFIHVDLLCKQYP